MQEHVQFTQERLMDFIRDFIDWHGYSPSLRDIVKGVEGISSTSHANWYLDALAAQQRILRAPRVARGIVILDDGGEGG